jgi:hypothetical protein
LRAGDAAPVMLFYGLPLCRIEICEIQLLHLANKIKDTEVDHEIDNYLPAINNVLESLSKEELILNLR